MLNCRTRCTQGVRIVFFPEQECNPLTVLACIYLILLQRKSCSVHMTMFEIVVHQLNTIIGMMYLGADN